MASTSEHHLIAQRYLSDLWSRGRLATVNAIVDPTCEFQDPLCGLRRGPDAIKAAVCELRLAFPDLTFSLDAFVVDAGEQLALRWSAYGTHRAPLLGIPATDRTFVVSGMLLLRYRANRLIAITMCWEPTHLLAQLGLYGAEPAGTRATSGRTRLAQGTERPPNAEAAPAPESTWAAATQEQSELDAGWV